MLADAAEQVGVTVTPARGTVVIGVHHAIAVQCLADALPRLCTLYPELQIDLRYLSRPRDEQLEGVDMFLALGWPQQIGGLVHRRIGAVGFVVCAAPSYWQAHARPQHPSELQQHRGPTYRAPVGALMDLWRFERGDEEAAVAARGPLVSDTVHLDTLIRAAVGGAGVVRMHDWHASLSRAENWCRCWTTGRRSTCRR